jgi:inorganic triphosphatase YgiF
LKLSGISCRPYKLAESPFSKFERAYIFRKFPEKSLLDLSKKKKAMYTVANHKNIYGKQAKILPFN